MTEWRPPYEWREKWEWIEHWVPELGSKPDRTHAGPSTYSAIWYNSYDRFGKMTAEELREASRLSGATMVILSREAYVFIEYLHISEWYMDEPWEPEEHGDFYRLRTVQMDPRVVKKVLLEHFKQEAGGVRAAMKPLPRKPEEMARWFSRMGSAAVFYGRNVEDDEADSLP